MKVGGPPDQTKYIFMVRLLWLARPCFLYLRYDRRATLWTEVETAWSASLLLFLKFQRLMPTAEPSLIYWQ
jgi:hypothetical protein